VKSIRSVAPAAMAVGLGCLYSAARSAGPAAIQFKGHNIYPETLVAGAFGDEQAAALKLR
jgi:hypothetical protein